MSNALYVAWRSGRPESGGWWSPVGKLEHAAGVYRFAYTQGARHAEFDPFPGMTNLDVVYESDKLFPLFANRLLSRSRPEYDAYLTWSGFDPNTPPDPLAILGVTEGIRQTDQLEVFPCPVPDADGCFLTKFFLHGLRWMPPATLERVARLTPNEPLSLMPDIQNPYDCHAVALRTTDDRDRLLVGYVPRYLARDFTTLCYQCNPDFMKVTVERVNPGAPMQMRVLCRMSACWPEEFDPCSDDAFQPIAGMEADTRA